MGGSLRGCCPTALPQLPWTSTGARLTAVLHLSSLPCRGRKGALNDLRLNGRAIDVAPTRLL